jgi:hypothetical protein
LFYRNGYRRRLLLRHEIAMSDLSGNSAFERAKK